MRLVSDVVVVGAGVIGLAVAYYLAREKVPVTLVERGGVGREASWAAAGYLSFQGNSNRPGPRLELTRASARMYDGWVRELGELTPADTGFWRSGLLELAPEMAIMPIRPIKGTIVLLDVAAPPTREILVSSAGSLYPRTDGKLLLGATMEDVGYDRQVKLEAVQTLVQQGLALVPGLRDATLVTAWTGLRPYSHDNVPYLGQVPDLEGAFVGAGHYRSGISLAPITGLLLKQMILGQALTLPVEPYRMARLLIGESLPRPVTGGRHVRQG